MSGKKRDSEKEQPNDTQPWNPALTALGYTEESEFEDPDDKFGPATGPDYQTAGFPLRYWTTPEEGVVLRWDREKNTLSYQVTGLFLTGDITRERLQNLNLQELRATGFQGIAQHDMPSEDQLWAQRANDLISGTPIGDYWPGPRDPDEPIDDFYTRQAKAYIALSLLHPEAPTKALADEAGVPFHTANRWVREARKRGYLPERKK